MTFPAYYCFSTQSQSHLMCHDHRRNSTHSCISCCCYVGRASFFAVLTLQAIKVGARWPVNGNKVIRETFYACVTLLHWVFTEQAPHRGYCTMKMSLSGKKWVSIQAHHTYSIYSISHIVSDLVLATLICWNIPCIYVKQQWWQVLVCNSSPSLSLSSLLPMIYNSKCSAHSPSLINAVQCCLFTRRGPCGYCTNTQLLKLNKYLELDYCEKCTWI